MLQLRTAAQELSLTPALLIATLLCAAWQIQTAAAQSGSSGSGSETSGQGSSNSGSREDSIAQRVAETKLCMNNMMHRVLWTPAHTGGPNCAGACRSYGGGSNQPYLALNTGVGKRPYFLCRAPDPSFGGSVRAGCAASSKATTCYTYADGGPLEWGKDTVLHAHRMHCACVADTSHAAYSGCNKPVWLPNTGVSNRPQRSTTCAAFCATKRRSAIEDHPGQGRFVCRPRPNRALRTVRMGWTGYSRNTGRPGSGIACHFISVDVRSNEDVSVYSFDYECLCI